MSYVQVSREVMAGACTCCRRAFLTSEVVVRVAASSSRQQITGGLPPVSNLYCTSCYDSCVKKAEQTWMPTSSVLGAAAPSGVHTRRCFKVKGSVADPLECFR